MTQMNGVIPQLPRAKGEYVYVNSVDFPGWQWVLEAPTYRKRQMYYREVASIQSDAVSDGERLALLFEYRDKVEKQIGDASELFSALEGGTKVMNDIIAEGAEAKPNTKIAKLYERMNDAVTVLRTVSPEFARARIQDGARAEKTDDCTIRLVVIGMRQSLADETWADPIMMSPQDIEDMLDRIQTEEERQTIVDQAVALVMVSEETRKN